jgi:hypothetical protein
MRDDLNKQLCERERRGSKNKFKSARRVKAFNTVGEEGELLSSHESMTERHNLGWGRKSFNENLNPLYGAVRKAVGRPWNKFYSELCQTFDMSSVINKHILQHLEWYVEKELYVGEDGFIWVRRQYSRGDVLLKDSGVEFYVDPRDGILRRNKWLDKNHVLKKQKAAERQKEILSKERFVEGGVLRKLEDEQWYFFTLLPIPEGRVVFTPPAGADRFNINAKYPNWAPKWKNWDQLSDHEKAQFGTSKIEGNTAYDVFTGATVMKDKGRLRENGKWWYSYNGTTYPRGMYHASKKSASHKQLRDAGIV